MPKGANSALSGIFRRISGASPSEKMEKFLKNLSWSFFGVIASSAILFFISISAGRILGPEQYGYFSILAILANGIALFANFGFDQSTLKYIASTENTKKRSEYFSNSLRVVSTMLVSILVILAALKLLNASLPGHLPSGILLGAALYATVMALRQTHDAYIRATDKFKLQAAVKVVEAVASLLLFLFIFFVLKQTNFYAYTTVIGIAGLITIGMYAVVIFREIKLQPWSPSAYSKTKGYAFHGVLVSVVGVALGNVDRLFLNQSLGATEVGIYSAYMLVPSTLAGYFSTAVVNVFFPLMNTLPDKDVVLKKLDKMSLILAIPLIVVYFLLGYAVISIFGPSYRLDPLYLLLASLYGFLLIYIALLAAVVGSSSVMYKKYARFMSVKLVVLISVYALLSSLGQIRIPILMGILLFGLVLDIALFRASAKIAQKKPRELR